MLQIGVLIVVAFGIAGLSRGRGAKTPWVFGAAAIIAFVIGSFLVPLVGRESVVGFLLPWLCVGFVASMTRFTLGAGRSKPDSMWSCPYCHMVNESSYVVCQACSRPWDPA